MGVAAIRLAFLTMLAVAPAACSTSPGGPERGLDRTSTASIAAVKPKATPNVIDAVAPSDWERIRLVASTSIPTSPNGDILDWTNPETGSTGTISPVAAARSDPDGRNCRPFALTVSDVRGIRRYSADACRATDGMWQISSVSAEDSALM